VNLASFFLLSATVFAQLPPKHDLTVTLVNTPTVNTVKQMTTLVKVVGQVMDVSFDETHNAFSLRGFEHQLGLAEWLLHAAEKPPDSNEYVMQPDLRIDDRALVTRVHYLNDSGRLNIQEILTISRVMGIRLTEHLDQPAMIAFRGTASEASLGDWLATNLDAPAGAGYKSFTVPSQGQGADELVRIFFLDAATSPAKNHDMMNAIRQATGTNAVFNKTSPPAVVIRGTSAMISQAEQIVSHQP